MMTSSFLDKIDWSRPWLAHVKAVGQAVAAAPDWRAELNRRSAECGLHNHRGLPIQFIPQADLPNGIAYESHISQSGGVPTRDNLHDFFNALVWLTFPRIKSQLNALQARELEKAVSTQSSRGKLRDAATIFDENAVLLVTANQSLVDALCAHHWFEVFVERRTEFTEECQPYVFGHALMEKMVTPYKAITGHMWVLHECPIHAGRAAMGRIDTRIAAQLADSLTTRSFSPLPVLGVPGWCSGQDTVFYADKMVFRAMR